MWCNAGRYRRGVPQRRKSSDSDSTSDEDEPPPTPSEDEGYAVPPSEEETSDEEDAPAPCTLIITRRQRDFGVRSKVTIARQPKPIHAPIHLPRNLIPTQQLWMTMAKTAGKLFPKTMWRILRAVINQSKVTQDKVLQAVMPLLSTSQRREWPKTRVAVDNKIKKKVGSFYPRVTRHVTIDLSHVKLSGMPKTLKFTYLDPVFAWVRCAAKLSRNHQLHFNYEELRHPETDELLFGASVANGLIMKRACMQIPECADMKSGPALFGLSWDAGNATKRRSYTPILISVANSDYSGAATCTCIAYLPRLKLSKKILGSPAGHRNNPRYNPR